MDAMPHGPEKTRRGAVTRRCATEPPRRRHGGHLLPLLAAGIQAHDVAQHASTQEAIERYGIDRFIDGWMDIHVYKY